VEESAEELYEDAPCGYMSSLLDGTIVRVNRTFLRWTGLERDAVVGRRIESVFSPASRLFFEVHAAPQLLIISAIFQELERKVIPWKAE
jgi:PAS domain S-box-containing protein